MLLNRSANNLRKEDFRVRLEDRPGWVLGTSRAPREEEEIFCAAGAGKVTAVRGRTGDGSSLVQIRLEGPAKPAYFAAASNVLLPPAAAVTGEAPPATGFVPRAEAPSPVGPSSWLRGSGSARGVGT
jgi:hypothetical protein